MNIGLKIGFFTITTIVVIGLIFLWRFSGMPYYRISLIGQEYIENSDELIFVNEQPDEKFYLIKKYKYSKDTLLLGFGGGNSSTDDYYSYGVADKNKNILLEPEYKFISSKTNANKEPIIYGVQYVENDNGKMMFYKIIHNRVKLISEKESL